MGIAGDIAIILVAAFVGGLIAQRLGLPIILGYILAGVVIGPNTPGVTVGDPDEIEVLAEIGVALLLFAIGLDFPLEEMAPVRRIALIGTPIQMGITGVFGYGLGQLLGIGWEGSVWLGAMLSISSTAVVLKTLGEQGVLNTLASRVIVGMLVVQDLAVVPLLIILPELQNLGEGITELGVRAAEAVAFIVGMALFGSRIFPWVMARIASWNQRELFLISVVAIGLGIGYATFLVGLSFAFGAFVAGIVLNRSEYSHQALADIGPLRDVFVMLFFVSVGLLLEPQFLVENAGTVALIVAAVFVIKGLIFAGVARSFGYGNIAPFAVGLGLFQVGEFSFVIAQLGLNTGAISEEVYSIVLTTAVVTMALTPFATRLAPLIYGQWRRRFPRELMNTFNVPESGLRGHVVIAGHGRVGRFVARLLDRLEQPFVVIDNNPSRADEAREAGFATVSGDAAAEPVLNAAGVDKARLVILTVPDLAGAQLALERVKRLNPKVHVVARSGTVDQLGDLGKLGVYEAVQPEFEAGIELGRQALVHLGFGAVEVQRMSDEIRGELYAPVSGRSLEGEILARLGDASRMLETEWIRLPEGSPLEERTIGALGVRSSFGVSVVAIVREGEALPSPGPEAEFRAGDTVSVLGTAEQRATFRRFATGEKSEV